MDSPRDHRYSAIWQALTEATRSELLTLASHDQDPPTSDLIAGIRRNGGMTGQPPWMPTPPPTPLDVISAEFLDWVNRILRRPGVDFTGTGTKSD